MLSSTLWEPCLEPLSTKHDYAEQSFEKIFHDKLLFIQESNGVEFLSLKSPSSIATFEHSFEEIFADELRILSEHGKDVCLRNSEIEVLIDEENANE